MKIFARMNSLNSRRGIALLMTIAAMVFVSAIGAVLLGLARSRLLDLRREESAIQAEFLAEAALDRAAAKLQADPSYTGEIWKISAKEMGGREAAQVVIAISADSRRPNRREARAVADFPVDTRRRSRRTRTICIDLKPEARP